MCVAGGSAGTRVCLQASDPRPCSYHSDCERVAPAGSLACATDGLCRPACRADYDCQIFDPRATCDLAGACLWSSSDGGMDAGADAVADVSGDVPPGVTPTPLRPPPNVSATSRTVRFRVAHGADTDATRIEFCRDRACARPMGTPIDVPAAMSFVDSPMTPTGTIFWRVVGLRATVVVTTPSAPRMLTVPSLTRAVSSTSGLRVDTNGDGQSDLLAGAPRTNSLVGRLYEFRTSTGGMSGWSTRSLEGPAGAQSFGGIVAPAGDVNGDGYGDVIVSAPDTDRSNPLVFVLLGSATGLDLARPISVTRTSTGSPTSFGFSVGAGDFNGDGLSDLIVGDNDAQSRDGEVAVYLGTPTGVAAPPPQRLTGPAGMGLEFGITVAGVGDVDADGFDDALVASPGPMGGSAAVQLYHGSSSASPLVALMLFRPSTSGTLRPTLAGLGDVNGDGYPDMAIGSGGAASMYGEVAVFLGGGSISPRQVATLHDPDTMALAAFGAVIVGLGDVDGDGFNDFAVGGNHPSVPQAVHVYLGGRTILMTPAQTIVEPSGPGTEFGIAMSGGVDFDGDGVNDLLVGAPAGAAGVGIVHVFRRLPMPMLFEPTPSAGFSVMMDDRGFGGSVGALGQGG